MIIEKILWIDNKKVSDLFFSIKAMMAESKITLLEIETKGLYFEDTPLLGCQAEPDKEWRECVIIPIKEQGENGRLWQLEIIFSTKIKRIFSCSTSKNIIYITVIKK